ncbi:hypothetical protein TRFO_08690 [Tritrichomonas foetus]|uniref:HMG box domain-containing protein n=1 Tax=Tritrichomonas foetus TaxID=1144522 RepID=A0A1J4JK27_9EUKA|nr:hypothetical protein TRFO_08690 [Tritrichomonas foetus]|eukprot:OHS98711.1 hypothetical protein TRFO_08690 [Tritrichomonas foetus]
MEDKVTKTRTARSTMEPQQEENEETPIKRPPNAYMLFCKEIREQLLQKEPDLTYKSVMNRFGELWKNMTKEEKAPYKDKARQLQSEFKAKHPNYKYKPRKQKISRQPANHLTLPAGISNAEASYLMLLGAQTLLNQKGGQQQGQQPQMAQLTQAVTAAAAVAEADKKNLDVGLPFAPGDIPNAQPQIANLPIQMLQNAANSQLPHMPPPATNYPWNQQKQ